MKAQDRFGGIALVLICSVAVGVFLGGLTAVAGAADWPNWRGPGYNGISTETDWNADWPEGGPKLLWKISVGTGFSSIVVSDDRAYTMGNVDDKDIVYCLDARTGTEIWRHEYAEAKNPQNYEGGPNATPTVAGGRVYTFSRSGQVHCLDAASGGVIWQEDLKEKFGIEAPKWGLSGSALVVGNVVILNAGTWGIALDKTNGKVVWESGTSPGGYATAVPYSRGQEQCVVMFGAKGVAGLLASSGQRLWELPWTTSYDVNAADPIVSGDTVFVSSGYGTGCALLKVQGDKAEQVWSSEAMRNQCNSSVLLEGHIYGFDGQLGGGGKLTCLDHKSGKVKWSQDGLGTGSLMAADGKLIILGEKGKLVIAEAKPDRFRPLSSVQLLTGRCWSVPVLANGRIYARNAAGDFACVDVGKKAPAVAPVAGDWPQWHGPSRDNISKETGLLKSWPEQGPALLWSTKENLGQGYSTVAIADGFIYTTGMIDERGILFGLDLHGNLKWKKEYGPEWSGGWPGVRCTPTVDGPSVYVVSGKGTAACFDAKTGEEKWTVDALGEFEGEYGKWGIAESPLIVADKMICTPGGRKATVVALDKKTGDVVWASESMGGKSSYCSPMLVEMGETKLIVTMTDHHIIGIDAENGEILWTHDSALYQGKAKGINPNTPIYHDGSLYVTSGYGKGGAKLKLSADGRKVESQEWVNLDLDCHHGGVVRVGGYIYGSNFKGKWLCLDWQSGRTMYQVEWIAKGSVSYADGMLYCYEEKNGTVALVKASPEAFDVVSSFTVSQGEGMHWAHPVICNGRLYIRHGNVLAAYDIRARTADSGGDGPGV